ncbi:MAG: FitA-like ribbon-helix-helix domain-containing protein [Pseudonocardia sp.]
MTDLLIRNLDPDAHRELKRRADRAGQSVQSYVAGLLEAHTARPALADWLAELEEIPPVEGVSGADAVRAARDELL